jgi:hypothetical protein
VRIEPSGGARTGAKPVRVEDGEGAGREARLLRDRIRSNVQFDPPSPSPRVVARFAARL